jgi:hypothetical protein
MLKFYENNKYPNSIERQQIADQCELSMEQVRNWFKNKRKRESDKGLLKGTHPTLNHIAIGQPIDPQGENFFIQNQTTGRNYQMFSKKMKMSQEIEIMAIEEDEGPEIKPEPIDPDDEPLGKCSKSTFNSLKYQFKCETHGRRLCYDSRAHVFNTVL